VAGTRAAVGTRGVGTRGVAAVRVGESAEDRSWDGAEERADEGTGLPWAKVEGHRAGVHRAGSGDPLPIVKVMASLPAGASDETGMKP